MKVSIVNDWQYLFKDWAIGGRFASFTFISISWMKVGMPEVDGFTFIVLGLGIRIGQPYEVRT